MDYVKEQSVVNDSVTFLRERIPLQVKEIAYKYREVAQLIGTKLKDLQDYRSGIYAKDAANILNVPFTKLVLALDEAAFIDLHVFFRNLIGWNSYGADPNEKPFKDTSDVAEDTGRIGVSHVEYKHMQAPYHQFKKYLTSTMCYDHTYDFVDDIPLLKVTPNIIFEGMDRVRDKFNKEPFENTYYYKSFDFIKDVNIYGIGMANTTIRCGVEIDIEGILTLMYVYMVRAVHNYLHEKYKGENDMEAAAIYNIRDTHERNLATAVRNFEIFNKMDDEELETFFFSKTFELSQRIVYSSSLTFLATVSKIDKDRLNFIGEISQDILDLAVDNLYDETFNSSNHSDIVKRGSLIRLLSTNISPMIQSILMNNTETLRSNQQGGVATFIKSLVNDLYALKNQTWNYIKIPINNVKFRRLDHIGKIAKASFYLLDTNNTVSLKMIHEDIYQRNRRELSAFNGSDAIRVNGTYATNKRYLDLLKALLQNICYMTILRYRMSSLRSQKEYDSDELTLNRREYFDLNKTAFVQLRRNINQLNSKLFSVSKPEYVVNVGGINYDEDVEKPQGKKAFFNNFIYGITDETILTNTDLQEYASSGTVRRYDDTDKDQDDDYIFRVASPQEIMDSFEKLLRRKDSDYKGNITDKWFEILKGRVTGVISNPFSNHLMDNAFAVLETTEDFVRLPYNKIHTGIDQKLLTKGEEPNDISTHQHLFRVIDDSFEQQHRVFSMMSLEDLEIAFEKMGEEIAPGIVGDMSNNNILGDSVGYNFTLGIAEQDKTVQSNIESGIFPEEEVQQSIENLKAFKKRVDYFLATGKVVPKKKVKS